MLTLGFSANTIVALLQEVGTKGIGILEHCCSQNTLNQTKHVCYNTLIFVVKYSDS